MRRHKREKEQIPDWAVRAHAASSNASLAALAREVLRLRLELWEAQSEIEHLESMAVVTGKVNMRLMTEFAELVKAKPSRDSGGKDG